MTTPSAGAEGMPSGGVVVERDRVVRHIAEQIADDLHDHGSTIAAMDELPISTEAWRRLARATARSMRRPIRTELMNGRINAFITDWPRAPHEIARRRRYLGERLSPGQQQ